MQDLSEPEQAVMSHSSIRSEEQFEARGEEFLCLELELRLHSEHHVTFAQYAESPARLAEKIAKLREFELLDEGYQLRDSYGATPADFLLRAWYWRNLTELLHDSSGFRPLLTRQRIAAIKADRELYREETRTRLQGGQVFDLMRHHRHRRGGQLHFTRSLHP